MHPTFVNAAGHQRAAVTLRGYHTGRPPRNKGSCRRRHEPFYAHRAGMPTSIRNFFQIAVIVAVGVCMIARSCRPCSL
jgi:hypothetical protein